MDYKEQLFISIIVSIILFFIGTFYLHLIEASLFLYIIFTILLLILFSLFVRYGITVGDEINIKKIPKNILEVKQQKKVKQVNKQKDNPFTIILSILSGMGVIVLTILGVVLFYIIAIFVLLLLIFKSIGFI